jgi:hypothetical protein
MGVPKIGIVALQRSQTRVDLDLIRREFEAWQTEMQHALDDVFTEDQGRMAQVLSRYLGEGGELTDLFDPDRKESAIGRIQAIFDQHFSGDGAKFARLLDCTERDSPLCKLRQVFEDRFKAIDDKMNDLGKSLAAKEAALAERELGTQKGQDFEDMLQTILDRSATPFGDEVTPVGAVAAVGGRSKKGDFVIDLNDRTTDGKAMRVLVEAKRESKPLEGKTGILQEMELGMANRSAQFAIAVFSDDACPKPVGRLRAYPRNRVICSIAPDGSDALALGIAYRLARVELGWQLRHDSRGIDQARVTDAIERALEKLGQFKGLKQNMSSLINTAGGIRAQLDTIEADIRCELDGILVEVKAEE